MAPEVQIDDMVRFDVDGKIVYGKVAETASAHGERVAVKLDSAWIPTGVPLTVVNGLVH